MQVCGKTAMESLTELVRTPDFEAEAKKAIWAENPFLARQLADVQDFTGTDTISMPHIAYYALRQAQIQSGLKMPIVTPQIWEEVIAESHDIKNFTRMVQSLSERNPNLYDWINSVADMAPEKEKVYAKVGKRTAFLVYSMLEVAEANERVLRA